MKFISSSILFSVFALLLSCGSETNENFNKIEVDQKLLADLPPQVNRSEDKTEDFINTFTGTINNNDKIEMVLIKDGSNLTGKYNYEGENEFLRLDGTIEDSGVFVIYEFNDEGEKRGIFNGHLIDDKAKGNWSKTEDAAPVPFLLKVVLNEEKVSCSEKEIQEEGLEDPIVEKTCSWKNYRSVSEGYPDEKGIYSYQYKLFKKQDDEYTKIDNAALFNNPEKLLQLVNNKIEEDFNKISAESVDCFEGISFSPFKIEDLGIEFDEGKIKFNVSFGLDDSCMSDDGTIISLPLGEVEKLMNS